MTVLARTDTVSTSDEATGDIVGSDARVDGPQPGRVPTPAAFAGAVFVLVGLWWGLAALSDVLRDLHLAGSIAAVGVTDVLNPLVVPRRAAELLRVWHDWDASRKVTGQDLDSGVVLTVWLAIDVGFAVTLRWLLQAWATSRMAILERLGFAPAADGATVGGRSDGDRDELGNRVRATIPLLHSSIRLATAYLVFEVAENLFFWTASVPAWWLSASLSAAYVADALKWLALVAAAVPIGISYLAARHRDWPAGSRGDRPEGPLWGYVQTMLDLRAQVLAVGFVCAALLYLPGNVRPQLHDIVRGWHHQWPEAIAALVLVGTVSALTWWTGRWTLRRVEGAGTLQGGSLEDLDGPQRRLLVLAAAIACVIATPVVMVLGGRKQTLLVIAAALALWLWCTMSGQVRTVTVTRKGYQRRLGVVRVLTFLPLYALAVVWVRAEIGRMLTDPWPYRLLVMGGILVGLWFVWRRVTQWHPKPAQAVGVFQRKGAEDLPVEHGVGAACRRVRRREILVPLVLAVVAALALALAGASLRASWTLGAVGMVALSAIVLLGLFGALTTAFFQPPRGPLALVRLKRFPIITAVVLLALVVSALVETPGFHKARVHPSTTAARATEGSSVRERTSLQSALDRWKAVAETEASPMKWRPLVVLASSGGGGRAAYWTLLTLNCLFGDAPVTPDAPACARTEGAPSYGSVFAASGISGGSVGLTMFGADRTLDPDAVFGDGFVDPVVANLFTRDAPNVLFHAAGWRDRAARLEQAFEDKVPGLRAEFFAEAPSSTSTGWEPLLVLNSAAVEDGCRVVVSNVSVATETATDPATPFTLSGSCRTLVRWRLKVPPAATPNAAAIDAADQSWPATRDLSQIICASQNVSMSTAALLSARFPYVSPSGAVEFCGDPNRFTYLVDGGTIDSSAAMPASMMLEEIVRKARRWNAERPTGTPCVQPIVLQIDNGYEDVIATGAAGRPSELAVPLQSGLSGVTNNADTARQQLAVLGTQLHERAGCSAAPRLPTYLQVYPQSHPGTEAPLGWSLSDDSRTDMKRQLASGPNQCTLLALRYWMTGSTANGACLTGTVQTDDEDAQAATAHAVCLRDPANPGELIGLRTNAYGVFVYAGRQTPEPLDLVTDDESCGDLMLNHGATYGVEGSFALGYSLTTEAGNPGSGAGWSWPAMLLAMVLGAVLLLQRGSGASRQEIVDSCRNARVPLRHGPQAASPAVEASNAGDPPNSSAEDSSPHPTDH